MLRTGDSMGGEPIDHSVQRLVEGGVGASLCELVRADLFLRTSSRISIIGSA